MNRRNGFTLVELVSIILLLGILSVTIFPRIFDSSDSAPSAFQAQLITVLRNMQIRAMTDTRSFPGEDYPCFKVVFDNDNNAFGAPPLTYYHSDSATLMAGLEDTCLNIIETDTNINPEGYFIDTIEFSENRVDLRALNSTGQEIDYIEFDGAGAPIPERGSCRIVGNQRGCRVELCVVNCSDEGNARVQVCIEEQGFVHAGECGE